MAEPVKNYMNSPKGEALARFLTKNQLRMVVDNRIDPQSALFSVVAAFIDLAHFHPETFDVLRLAIWGDVPVDQRQKAADLLDNRLKDIIG